jgi:hypothetical protein
MKRKKIKKVDKVCGECYFWEKVTPRVGRCSILETVRKDVDEACEEFREYKKRCVHLKGVKFV